MSQRTLVCCMVAAAAVFSPLATARAAADGPLKLVFCCEAKNDLYRVATAEGTTYPRYDEPVEAVRAAPEAAGVLVLADGYPAHPTAIPPAVFEAAAKKRLRLYVEYPASLPGVEVGKPRRARLERAVVASDVFGDSLQKLRLLVIHDCHFVDVPAADPYLVLAKVAGYDTAVFGLDDTPSYPILFEHPGGGVLVSATKLSQFITARYAPKDAWQTVWRMVFGWLHPGAEVPALEWIPTVRPTYARDAELPADACREAIVRGVDWHSRARMLLDESWKDKYAEYRASGVVQGHNPVGPAPDPEWPAGDGRFGVLEGVNSQVRCDGSQPVRWWLRSDSNGESSLAFALRSKIDDHPPSAAIAGNLLDWVYFNSGLFQNDPAKANFGLVHWASDSSSLYGDNDIKIILGGIGTAAVLGTDRWDEVLLKNILGNFRTTGTRGFRGAALNNDRLLQVGWEHYWRTPTVHLAPHYQAWIWASYLWLYDKTKDPLLLERTRSAIRLMMANYPDGWRWTNGIQQERGRMLLTLAWLIRVDDRAEHRAWLERLAGDMQKCQHASGAIREELGPPGHGGYRPPVSNAEYGTREAAAIQENGDPMADMLYTCNFSFLGLHEAHAATGDPRYRKLADGLAEFFVRIQVASQAHPELDGAWFRSFDYDKWDYWGSNADAGWGAWSVEVGWTQAWIPTVLALRELDLNLWDLTAESRIGKQYAEIRRQMLPDEAVDAVRSKRVGHAAVDRPARLAAPADPRYPGSGAVTLTDGLLGAADHGSPEWLGFEGGDLEVTVDLGGPTAIDTLAARFLLSTPVGIFPPKRVEFAVSDDGQEFRVVATVEPQPPRRETGSLCHTVSSDKLNTRARFVRVCAQNTGTIPEWHPAKGRKAWLFADEVLVHSDGANPTPGQRND